MDLESGDTLYVEATTERSVRFTRYTNLTQSFTTRLTTEEARTLANALLAAVVEAEAHAN